MAWTSRGVIGSGVLKTFLNAQGEEGGSIYALNGAGRNVLMVEGEGTLPPRLQMYGAGDSTYQNEIHVYNTDVLRMVQGDMTFDSGEILGVNTPGMVYEMATAGAIAIETSSTIICGPLTLSTPAEWATWDYIAHFSLLLSDGSGASSGVGTTVTIAVDRASVAAQSFSTQHEVTDLNYHDINSVSGVHWRKGVTGSGAANYYIRATRTATAAVSSSRANFLVQAFRRT